MTDENEPPSILPTPPGATEDKKPPGVEATPPVPDEFMGRGNKKKKKGKADKNRPVKTQVEEQIDAALATSSLQVKRKDKKKKQFKYGAIAAGVGLLGYLVYWGFMPYQGTIAFGICKVFLENYVRYPSFLRLSTVEEFDTSVRIWYTQVDSFGEYRMEPIQCYYKQDPGRGTIVDKILVNRREVDHKLVDDFNRSLSTIIAYPPDLTIPSPLPDSLEDLQFNADMFRKSILGPAAP